MPKPINLQLWQQIQAIIPKQDIPPNQLPFFCGVIHGLLANNPVKVYIVDGDKIKVRPRGRVKSKRGDEDFMDFVEGGNGIEDPGLCRPDEIVLDDNIKTHDLPFICMHEAVEMQLMAHGVSYNTAHPHANDVERQLRQMAMQGQLPVQAMRPGQPQPMTGNPSVPSVQPTGPPTSGPPQ